MTILQYPAQNDTGKSRHASPLGKNAPLSERQLASLRRKLDRVDARITDLTLKRGTLDELKTAANDSRLPGDWVDDGSAESQRTWAKAFKAQEKVPKLVSALSIHSIVCEACMFGRLALKAVAAVAALAVPLKILNGMETITRPHLIENLSDPQHSNTIVIAELPNPIFNMFSDATLNWSIGIATGSALLLAFAATRLRIDYGSDKFIDRVEKRLARMLGRLEARKVEIQGKLGSAGQVESATGHSAGN